MRSVVGSVVWRRALLGAVVCIAGLAPCSCSRSAPDAPVPEAAGHAVRVVACIDPIAYLADRIGGPFVDTSVLVAPGQDPHTYEPTPGQMARLAESRIYFAIGLPFEDRLLPRIRELSPDLSVVDAGRGVPRRAGDPHIWMSPRLAKTISRNIGDALVAADPPHAPAYRERLAVLLSDLDTLDAEVAATLGPLNGQSIYVYHDAFGYFADAYGLKQVAIETGGREPGPRHVADLIERARADGVHVIFVQPQFSTMNAEAIAREISGAVVPFDPLASDYIASMRKAALTVRDALGAGPREPR